MTKENAPSSMDTCEGCYHWRETSAEAAKQIQANGADDNARPCRRYPPTVSMVGHTALTVYPLLSANEPACGEFKHKAVIAGDGIGGTDSIPQKTTKIK